MDFCPDHGYYTDDCAACLKARVAELEAALQEIVDLNYGEGMGDAMVQIAEDALAPKGDEAK